MRETNRSLFLCVRTRPIQSLLLEKFGQKICDLEIVQIGEWEARIAANTYFGQMDDSEKPEKPEKGRATQTN